MLQQFYQEPIYSVQQQACFQVKQLKYLLCRSSHSDDCYRDYLEKNLTVGFGQLKESEYEKVEYAKPSLVILSPTIEIDEVEIMKLTDKLVLALENRHEHRKRYGIVHADKSSYIIGGYILNPGNLERQMSTHDYKYDHKAELLQPITSLPATLISFGLATDGKYIAVVGGHSPSNRPSAECFLMDIDNLPEKWVSLPNLPLPTSGPGVGMFDGEIHVIGGFDILSSESITHGEYYRLTWPTDTQWRKQTSIESIRARSLVLLIPNRSAPLGRLIYVAGGYNVNTKRRPMVVPTILMFEENDKQWKLVTTIPNFKLLHGLSFFEDKLHVSESTLKSEHDYDTRIIRSYDFTTNQWIESSKAR
ncbi:unnamed protein product [Adineta ricciae]|uniref:Uncharacterized protein n=1 Tax=Adineta ricciae TaxID=249248 RepID=A0A813ST58_ADIRI|nr:unnamed protein product [Adineta ricciae]